MKYIIKITLLILFLLTACTDKKQQNTNDSGATPAEVQEIEKIETLTNEMEKTTESMEQTAQELDALLEEIDK